MMDQIDAKLTGEGVHIISRPMLAVREVSIEYGLAMPLIGEAKYLPPELLRNAALSEAIIKWYQVTYGDRLKVDPCAGQMVVLLDGDIYALRIPRFFGSVNFVLTREWLADPGISRGPATCNITQLVVGMTSAKASRLSDAALAAIGAGFDLGLPAAYALENTDHKLMFIARGDVRVAIDHLIARDGRFAESKWASLQVAEKVLKAGIDLAGAKFKATHDLADLCRALSDTGLVFDAAAQIAKIQCAPGIRYGDLPCSRDEALAAHHASLEVVSILRNAGAAFTTGLGNA